MELKPNITEQEKEKIFQAYTTSFPSDERRNDDDFWKIFTNPNAEILSIYKENFVGYFILWHLSNFVFVEHFEIFEEFRGQNFGSQALEFLAKKYPHLILETEPKALNEIAKRRVGFYQRNGFHIIKKDYIQPSYGEGKSPVNLWLMGNFSSPDEKFLERTITEIYKTVYQK